MCGLSLIVGFLLSSCLISRSVAAETWVVREDGAGPVKVGISLSELNGVLREKFSLPLEKDERRCFYVNPREHPDISIMIVDGRVARFDVVSAGVSTSKGIQVGDSEARARHAYGPRMKVSRHAYTGDEGGHYLTFRSSDARYGIRFETDQGKITMFYAGRYAAVQYIEGCE